MPSCRDSRIDPKTLKFFVHRVFESIAFELCLLLILRFQLRQRGEQGNLLSTDSDQDKFFADLDKTYPIFPARTDGAIANLLNQVFAGPLFPPAFRT